MINMMVLFCFSYRLPWRNV